MDRERGAIFFDPDSEQTLGARRSSSQRTTLLSSPSKLCRLYNWKEEEGKRLRRPQQSAYSVLHQICGRLLAAGCVARGRASAGMARCRRRPPDGRAIPVGAPSPRDGARPADRYGCAMDPDRARELLARERQRIEAAIADLNRESPEEADAKVEPGAESDEGLYQDEFDS